VIARVWNGVVLTEKSDAYSKYLIETVVDDLKGTSGNRGVHIFRNVRGENAYYQIISIWDSYDSLKKFAGDNYTLARYTPDDREYLLKGEKYCEHYEIIYPSF